MNDLNHLEHHLDQMFTRKEVKKTRTFVAKYKGETIVTNSGKSSWKAVNHAKAAIILHFERLEHDYVYANGYSNYDPTEERRKEFREKLWQLISIEELK
jgi:hypothetical protein